jgi:hypothetical protein
VNAATEPRRTADPQLGPALALAALRTEHPGLPLVIWSIQDDGALRGNDHGEDVRSSAEAWAKALGTPLTAPFRFAHSGAARVHQGVHTVWRDVELRVAFYSAASAYPELAEAVTE